MGYRNHPIIYTILLLVLTSLALAISYFWVTEEE
jgi:hypothetical protein